MLWDDIRNTSIYLLFSCHKRMKYVHHKPQRR
nr:MAG TPA: hypothetical protein [Bacteriophage sp.]DAW83027.1 MAG TPA: hypothetical protein [Caudoviricetes sp.]